jgi:protein-S-isoprenylcysteine O-methyltransferase Ste14
MTEPSSDPNSVMRRGILKRILQILISILLMGMLLFFASGDLRWSWAWLYLGTYALGALINGAVMFRRNPSLIAERGEPKEGVKAWDRKLTRFVAPLWLLIFFVAGLDHRFGWTAPLPLWCHIAGLSVYLLGNSLTLWAINANAFFSTSVRIQHDRGHRVVDRGPYAFIRHPGYAGMLLHMLALPIMLGALWALIPAAVMNAGTVLRTSLEDRTLKAELDGYEEYAGRVSERLIPGLW